MSRSVQPTNVFQSSAMAAMNPRNGITVRPSMMIFWPHPAVSSGVLSTGISSVICTASSCSRSSGAHLRLVRALGGLVFGEGLRRIDIAERGMAGQHLLPAFRPHAELLDERGDEAEIGRASCRERV